MLYTGGTTGMPKGVMYAIGELTNAQVMGGLPLIGLAPPDRCLPRRRRWSPVSSALGTQVVSIPCAPLMHGTGAWGGCMIPLLAGGHIVTLTSRSLDAHELLATVERHEATAVTIVGDTLAKPIIKAIDEGKPDGTKYDTSSIALFLSSGVMWTTEVKQQLVDRIEQAMLIDAMGASEGQMGSQVTMKGLADPDGEVPAEPDHQGVHRGRSRGRAGLRRGRHGRCGRERPARVLQGSGEVGQDLPRHRWVRYSFPGDFAKVDADGSIILLGRGSQVINSGGEKIYPEEVEEAVKRVEGIQDCLVIGIEDEKFGQAVTAVASRVDGSDVDAATVIAAVKHELAGYKAPKSIVFVPVVPRAPNGKADYRAAKVLAADAV